MMRSGLVGGVVTALTLISTAADAGSAPETRCLLASGRAATACVDAYAAAVGRCRDVTDAACEAALRAPAGGLEGLLAATEAPVRRACTPETAEKLTFSLGLDDLVFRTAQACQKWAEDFLELVYAESLSALSGAELLCQQHVAKEAVRLRNSAVRLFGRLCTARQFTGRTCHRLRRDRYVAARRVRVRRRILEHCGATFDALGLSPPTAGPTVEARVDDLLGRLLARARHFALRIYPPLDLGPTELFGPHPVGVRTLDLVDPARLNTTATGPRPVKAEVYYPSTAAAVDGVPRDIARLLGIDLVATATYRDVARAPGRFPIVLYSASSGGPRFENVMLATHLASHGFLVVAAEHHGNDFLDPSSDPDTLVNRPRDMSFLIDQLLAFDGEAGNFLEGAIDGSRIGATGHSYGGYTAMALATGPFHLGTFTESRVKAIFPLDGSAQVFVPEFPGIFSTIQVPTLLVSGTLGVLERFFMQPTFDALLPGPVVTAYADLIDAGHLTFNDACEVPEALIGFVAECEPDHIPWRYARHLVNYLALNFFDGVLNGNADALARLAPERLSSIEDLVYQRK